MGVITDAGVRMLSSLPGYYVQALVLHEVLDAIGSELDKLREAQDALIAGSFVRTADDWALERWEAELGLPVDPPETLQERQDRVISKLRGDGTATRLRVKEVAESYAFGDVDVDDLNTAPALPDYTIRVTFVSEHGIPTNLGDLQIGVREIVPAHLEIEYVFTYITWAEVDAQGWTWGDVDALGMTWAEFESQEL